MDEFDANDLEEITARIQTQAGEEKFRVTQHAQQEMVEEDILLSDVLEAIASGRILENYPKHKRGACCLLYGRTDGGRPLHIVCTTARSILILITVYEPKEPKWLTPTRRSRKK